MNTIPQAIDFTFRVVVLIFAMTIGVMFVIAGARNALAANLKSTAMVYGSVFTVGDIFAGVPKDIGEKVLGPAPQPGHDLVLNARTLMRVAVALDLPWRPQTSQEQVVIRSAATIVDTNDIKDLLKERLKENGATDKYDLNFYNIQNPQIILPAENSATAELIDFNYDPQSSTFRAKLAAPSASNAISELEVGGKIERLVTIPVINKPVSGGDIIRAQHIDWLEIKHSDLQNDIILNEKDLLGMTPRRMLESGKPVRKNQLERPQVVSRGDMITITYNNGFMILTAEGRAMQDGAKGDTIRVVNTGSNRTVEATIEDQGIVTVIQ